MKLCWSNGGGKKEDGTKKGGFVGAKEKRRGTREDAVWREKTLFNLIRLIKTNVRWVRFIMFREDWCGKFGTAGES